MKLIETFAFTLSGTRSNGLASAAASMTTRRYRRKGYTNCEVGWPAPYNLGIRFDFDRFPRILIAASIAISALLVVAVR